MHAMDGEGGQFHVAFYMLSTLGGSVSQSTAAGEAGDKLRILKKKFKKKNKISILHGNIAFLPLKTLDFEDRIYSLYRSLITISTCRCLTAYDLSFLGHHLCHKYSFTYISYPGQR